MCENKNTSSTFYWRTFRGASVGKIGNGCGIDSREITELKFFINSTNYYTRVTEINVRSFLTTGFVEKCIWFDITRHRPIQ